MFVVVIVVWCALGAAVAPSAAAGDWRRPVPGAVAAPYAVHGSPYTAGQHRGVDLRARRGVRVRAACSGVVRFAGRLPGGRGGVSVVCGGLVATHLDLASVDARRGARVGRGSVIGRAAGPSVHLGARRLGERHGYVDPLGLLGADGPPRLGPAPVGRGRRSVPRGAPAPGPTPRAAPAPAAVPWAAWAGLALLAGGVPLGGLVRARRRRARVLAPVVAPVER